VDEPRERQLPTALGGIDLAFVGMAAQRFCARRRPDSFHRPRRLNAAAANVAAKDPLDPNRLCVTPLAPREPTLGERRRNNSKKFIKSMYYYAFLSHYLIFTAITSG
jgi:hypothetical protein